MNRDRKNESIEELKHPQEYEGGEFIIVDGLNEKETNDARIQAMCKRIPHKSFPSFIVSQDYYALPERTITAKGKSHHIFKPNNYRDLQKFYQD